MFSPNPVAHKAILVRTSHIGDEAALARLATLDSSPPLSGPAVVAEHDGALVAARSLETGREIADPFRPTAGILQLLRAATATRPGRARRRPQAQWEPRRC